MKKLILGIFCIGTIFLSGCSQSPEENFNEAKSLYEAQNYEKAFKLYKKAAEKGYLKAIYSLAWCYSDGKGVKEDKSEAVKWFRKAAELGYSNSQLTLGYCYDNGGGVEKDYNEALKWYRKAAEQGNSDAINNLGTMYEKGKGVFQDKKEALRLYLQAVEKGNNDYSLYNIGRFLREKEKKLEAYAFYALATKNGKDCSSEMYSLDTIYKVSVGYAVELSKKLEEEFYNKKSKGDAKAQFIIAEIYEDAENYSGAMQWYKKSAENGDVKANLAVGDLYKLGRGVEEDEKEALKWYRKAAEKGDSLGQEYVGNFYFSGRVVKKDYREALKWYTLAERRSDSKRSRNILTHMGECEFFMKNYEKALEHFHKAVKLDRELPEIGVSRTSPFPHFYIGVCYFKGYGIPVDKYRALAWFKEAKDAGDFFISDNLKKFNISF